MKVANLIETFAAVAPAEQETTNGDRPPRLADLDAAEVRAIQEEAARANPAALYILGISYCRADGPRADRAHGMDLLRRAAALGYAPALRAIAAPQSLAADAVPAAADIIPFRRPGRRRA